MIARTHPQPVRVLELQYPTGLNTVGWIVQTDPRADDALAAQGANCARRGRVPPAGTMVLASDDAADAQDDGSVRLLGAARHRTHTLAMRTPSHAARRARARRRSAGCTRPSDPCFEQDDAGDATPAQPMARAPRARPSSDDVADLSGDDATDADDAAGLDDDATPNRARRTRGGRRAGTRRNARVTPGAVAGHDSAPRDTASNAPSTSASHDDGDTSHDAPAANDAASHDTAARDPSAAASREPRPAANTARRRRALSTRERRALDRMLRAGRTRRPREAAGLEAAARRVADTAEDGGVTFAGIPIVGRHVVLAVDVSYSMREPAPRAFNEGLPAEATKLDMVRAQLTALLAALPNDVEVNIIAFSSARRALFDRPRTLDDAALDQAADWIAALAPEDETRPLDAVRQADAMGADQILLVTDGRPTYAESEEPALLEFATALPRANHRLDVVGIGPEQNASFLDTLAARGRGQAVHF